VSFPAFLFLHLKCLKQSKVCSAALNAMDLQVGVLFTPVCGMRTQVNVGGSSSPWCLLGGVAGKNSPQMHAWALPWKKFIGVVRPAHEQTKNSVQCSGSPRAPRLFSSTGIPGVSTLFYPEQCHQMSRRGVRQIISNTAHTHSLPGSRHSHQMLLV